MSTNSGFGAKIHSVLNPCSGLVVFLFAASLYIKPRAGKNELVLSSYSNIKKKSIPATALSLL